MTSFALQKTYLCIGDYLSNASHSWQKKKHCMNIIWYMEKVIKNSITYSMILMSQKIGFIFGFVF